MTQTVGSFVAHGPVRYSDNSRTIASNTGASSNGCSSPSLYQPHERYAACAGVLSGRTSSVARSSGRLRSKARPPNVPSNVATSFDRLIAAAIQRLTGQRDRAVRPAGVRHQ